MQFENKSRQNGIFHKKNGDSGASRTVRFDEPPQNVIYKKMVTLVESKWNDLVSDIYRIKRIASVVIFYTTPSTSVE